MSIATYDELKTAVADWTHRTDLTSRIPDFIKSGEAVLNRQLRTVDMETRATASTTTTSRFIALPTGFMEMQSMFIQNPAQEVVYIEPSMLREYVTSETATGKPTHFTVKDEIEFNRIPDAIYTLEMHYFKKYDIAADLTNWLLTNYQEAYLYAALAEYAMYATDLDLFDRSKRLLSEAVQDINRQEARKRSTHLAYLRVDDALRGRGAYNINTD